MDVVSFVKFSKKKHCGFLPRRVNRELEGVHWKGENGRDLANVSLLDRLVVVPDSEWKSDGIQWHKTCSSSFTSSTHIERLKKKKT